MSNIKILKALLFLGAAYFFMAGCAHLIGCKVPGLYLYFNVPSLSYQDKIISLLAFGWAGFFYTAFLNPTKDVIKTILFIGALAIIILTAINLTTDFKSLGQNIDPRWFHLETAVLFLYWLSLVKALTGAIL
jgi:hypothetical protein